MTFNLIFSIKNQYTVEESTIFLDFDSSIYHNHAFVVDILQTLLRSATTSVPQIVKF